MQNPLSRIGDVLSLKTNHSVVHTVTPDSSVFDTVSLMNEYQIGSVIVEDTGHIVGIFTERDVLVRVVAADLDPHVTRIGEVMTRDPDCITRTMSTRDVMVDATKRRRRHFPVVENGRLVGLVSIGDLMHFESQEQEHRIDAGILAMKTLAGR